MKGMTALASLLVVATTVTTTTSSELVSAVIRRLHEQEHKAAHFEPDNQAPFWNRAEVYHALSYPSNLRRLQNNNNNNANGNACDAQFGQCLKSPNCVDCFVELETKDIDWASVTAETPCSDVTKFLFKANHCKKLESDKDGRDAFCNAYNVCVEWTSPGGDGGNKKDGIDCSKLTECKWDGIHENFLGDGICHDQVEGCYNSAVCGYDGGDCCQDTCKTKEGAYVECGHEGYICKDPTSSKCDKKLNPACPNNGNDKPKPEPPTCKEGTTLYRLVMYDSFGDGWDTTKLSIADSKSPNEYTYKDLALKEGSQGTEFICLSKSPSCYHVDVSGGTWGKEVSWEVKPAADGAPSLGSGGSPFSCDFPVAGDSCTNTCTGRKDNDPTTDPDYKEYKTMAKCIADSCPIQIGACESDDVCVKCFQDIPEDYCYADDFFNALLDCALCKCTDSAGSDFCNSKASPNSPGLPDNDDNVDDFTPDPCSPAETVTGGNAVIAFGKCTDIDQASMMVTDFDQNNFGMLDFFESCAHSFKSKSDHGGKMAMDCLQILVDAKDGNFGDLEPASAPAEAIKALASHLYHNPEDFCGCATKASTDCPLCPSFMNFKTLLYESMDACRALDEIDCDAWAEFFPKCKQNLANSKGRVDFSKPDQCGYVHDGCGGAGPFPVFRRLDCDKEVSNEAWSFYTDYTKSCQDGGGPAPGPTPSTPAPAPTPPAPTPYVPSTDDFVAPSSPSKPYVPPEERGKNKKKKQSSESKPKKSHFLRNMFWLLLIGGGAYYYYKNYGFDFSFLQRYRRFRPVPSYSQGGDMYSGLTMESSTTFQPPGLPPTPVDMGGGNSNNGGHFI